MSAGHTPGPWCAEPADMFGDHNIVLGDNADDARAIAAVVSNLRAPSEVEANARLIAAAPDLLEACQELIGVIDSVDGEADYSKEEWAALGSAKLHAEDRIRAAIARATGEQP